MADDTWREVEGSMLDEQSMQGAGVLCFTARLTPLLTDFELPAQTLCGVVRLSYWVNWQDRKGVTCPGCRRVLEEKGHK